MTTFFRHPQTWFRPPSPFRPLESLLTASISHALHTTMSPKHAYRTSVAYETSFKIHTSTLQNKHFVRDLSKIQTSILHNERFVRDFPPTSHLTFSKTSISYETSSKSQWDTLPCCQAVSRFPLHQSQSHPPNLATSRFPAPAKKITRL